MQVICRPYARFKKMLHCIACFIKDTFIVAWQLAVCFHSDENNILKLTVNPTKSGGWVIFYFIFYALHFNESLNKCNALLVKCNYVILVKH